MQTASGKSAYGRRGGEPVAVRSSPTAFFRAFIVFIALAAVLFLTAPSAGAAKVDDQKVAKIQAGCIFHMAQLVTWPESKFKDKDAPIVIGFIGDETGFIADYFTSQSSKYTAQGRKLLVKRYQMPDPKGKATARVELFDKELRQTHILFIGLKGVPKYRILLEALSKSNVLTVGGAAEFTDGGGMSALTVEKDKLVIRVNLASVNQSELKISAQFLQHAIIVKK